MTRSPACYDSQTCSACLLVWKTDDVLKLLVQRSKLNEANRPPSLPRPAFRDWQSFIPEDSFDIFDRHLLAVAEDLQQHGNIPTTDAELIVVEIEIRVVFLLLRKPFMAELDKVVKRDRLAVARALDELIHKMFLSL